MLDTDLKEKHVQSGISLWEYPGRRSEESIYALNTKRGSMRLGAGLPFLGLWSSDGLGMAPRCCRHQFGRSHGGSDPLHELSYTVYTRTVPFLSHVLATARF